MVSSVRSRPNHYEVLGLAQSASAAEIAQAFASKMSLFGAHPVAEVTQLSIAYETLRDPARRRAYDDTLRPAPASKMGYSARWSAVQLATPADERFRTASQAQSHVTEEPKPEAPIDPRVAAIAASLRELAKPAASPDPKPELQEALQPEARAEADLDSVLQNIREFGHEEKDRLRDAERRPVGWKRPVLAIGGFLLGAGVLGTLAGLSVKYNAATAQADPAITVPLPEAEPSPDLAATAPGPVIPPDVRARIAKASRIASSHRPATWADQVAEGLSADGAEPASDQAATEPQRARLVAASLPLPDQTIASTIERIGYECGEIASTQRSKIPGVFEVTCTSGHSYKATPVRGRYHFRRMGSR